MTEYVCFGRSGRNFIIGFNISLEWLLSARRNGVREESERQRERESAQKRQEREREEIKEIERNKIKILP